MMLGKRINLFIALMLSYVSICFSGVYIGKSHPELHGKVIDALNRYSIGTIYQRYVQGAKYVIGPWHGGFGICFNSLLNHLNICRKNNLTPVVNWTGSFYTERNGFNGSLNPWEYYFKPTSHMKYARGDRIHYSAGDVDSIFSYYRMTPENRRLGYELIQRYVAINSIVQTKIDRFYQMHMAGKRTIGIHVRGTDKYTEEVPIPVTRAVEEALKYADDNTQFLFATDEQKLLDEAIRLLAGRKVIYYDCYRSVDGNPLHIRITKPSRAQLGEDVLVEIALLSKCDYFVHTLSNVSSIPLYFNPDLQHVVLRG